MTVIAAVAMSFGLFADEPAAKASHFISFEAADECVQDGKFVKAGWTGEASVIGLVGGYSYSGADARRDDDFAGGDTNEKCLKLETGKEVVTCTPGGDTDDIFFDQVVKFTGYEEAPTVTDGKIAVWMSAIESDDTVVGETNLYVTCAKVNAAGEATPTNICIGAYDIDAWHRVTIKSLGDIAEGDPRAGFLVYIDGAQVGSFAGIADADALKEKFQSYSASGILFPALASGTVTAVAYQGIGELDDVAIDDQGPEFARFVEGTVAQIPDAELVVTDENGDEIPVTNNKFQAAPGSTITLTYTADDGKFLTGGKETWTSDQIITQDNKDFTDLVKDVEALTKVAMYTKGEGEEFYAASIQEAFEKDESGIITIVAEEVVLTDTLVIPDAFEINLDGNTITLAADKTVGIDIQADGVAISGGTIASALAANVAGSKAINIPNVDVDLSGVTINAAHYEYAIYANCDEDCGGNLAWFYTDTEGKFADLQCDGVSISGNGSLFHVEGMTATLNDCDAQYDNNPLFAAHHQVAVYSSLNALTTITGEGSYEHVNALQSGDLGGKIFVDGDSTATFTGDIKSFMKVGAHPELEKTTGYAALFTLAAGTYDGEIVFVDESAEARDLDLFIKGDKVELDPPAGYKWDEDGILTAIEYATLTVVKGDEKVTAVVVSNATEEVTLDDQGKAKFDKDDAVEITVYPTFAEGYELDTEKSSALTALMVDDATINVFSKATSTDPVDGDLDEEGEENLAALKAALPEGTDINAWAATVYGEGGKIPAEKLNRSVPALVEAAAKYDLKVMAWPVDVTVEATETANCFKFTLSDGQDANPLVAATKIQKLVQYTTALGEATPFTESNAEAVAVAFDNEKAPTCFTATLTGNDKSGEASAAGFMKVEVK